MAVPTALLKFTQGALIGDGEALAGVPGILVTVENSTLANIQSWRINLVYVPPGQAAVPIASPLAQNPSSNTPLASFTPDPLPGCYRLQIFVYEGVGYTGDWEEDIRNFAVPDPVTGIIFPSYQMLPPKLPVVGTGEPNEKPDEMNFGGQPYGWDGFGTEGLLLEFMRKVVSGEVGGGGSFKYVPPGQPVLVQPGKLLLLEGRTVVDGYVRLDGHMRIIGRRRHPTVLSIVDSAMQIPNNCKAPVDPKYGPFTLTLDPRGTPGEPVELYSISDDPTPPVITVDGQGPLLGGQVSRQLTGPREYLRLERVRGHGWMVG